ncbi:hypothetical protein PRIPAC_84184, partial [Pristionchus pacificus]
QTPFCKMDVASTQSMKSKIFVITCYALYSFFSTFDGNALNGILPLLEQNFNINDVEAASLKTANTIVYTATLAVLWISGDYFQRRKLFLSSIGLWIVLSLLSIFLGSETFAIFVTFRALSTGAYSISGVLVPVMVADMFQDRALGISLMALTGCDIISGNFVGIISSWIVTSGAPWQSGLVVGPLLSIIPLLGLLCVDNRPDKVKNIEGRSIQKSLRGALGLFSIKSVVLQTAVMALDMFHVVAYGFFFPSMVLAAMDAYPEVFLGQSYTMVTTFFIVIKLAGTVIGMPMTLWFAQTWRHGSGLCSRYDENLRAFPIVMSAGALLKSCAYVAAFLLLAVSYPAFLVAMFLIGFGAAAGISLGMQSMIMVAPTNSRTSAVALARLIAGVVTTPAAQLIGLISDTLRGDSTLPYDRFHSYQLALLCSVLFAFASALCDVILVFFFKQDCERAEYQSKEEEDVSVDESSFLIGSPKVRCESLLEASVRSRTATASSYY